MVLTHWEGSCLFCCFVLFGLGFFGFVSFADCLCCWFGWGFFCFNARYLHNIWAEFTGVKFSHSVIFYSCLSYWVSITNNHSAEQHRITTLGLWKQEIIHYSYLLHLVKRNTMKMIWGLPYLLCTTKSSKNKPWSACPRSKCSVWLYREFFVHPTVQHSADKTLQIFSASRSLVHKLLTLGTEQRVPNTRERRHWKIFSVGVTVFNAVGIFIFIIFFTPNFCWWIQFEKAVGEFNLINSEIKYSSISKTKYSPFGLPALHLTFSSSEELWWRDGSSNFADVFNYRGAKWSVGFCHL